MSHTGLSEKAINRIMIASAFIIGCFVPHLTKWAQITIGILVMFGLILEYYWYKIIDCCFKPRPSDLEEQTDFVPTKPTVRFQLPDNRYRLTEYL